MNWPERPICHDDDYRNKEPFVTHPVEWRPVDIRLEGTDGYPQDFPFRTCSWCGSIHPEDLLRVLKEGAKLGGSDWKYGWPHKFYIEKIVSGHPAGVQVKCGSDSRMVDGKRVTTPIMGETTGFTHGKWYNVHLDDLDDECFKVVAEEIFKNADIRFERDDQVGIRYSAPYHGYQK